MQSGGSWFDFPEEIHRLILLSLSLAQNPREIVRFGETCKYNHGLFHATSQREAIWRTCHEKQFGALDGDDNLKEQTIAALLYREASLAQRPDEKQRLFHHLFQYLKPFHLEPAKTAGWAASYFVEMHWLGQGTKVDMNMGVNYLRESILKKSQKAPSFLQGK